MSITVPDPTRTVCTYSSYKQFYFIALFMVISNFKCSSVRFTDGDVSRNILICLQFVRDQSSRSDKFKFENRILDQLNYGLFTD